MIATTICVCDLITQGDSWIHGKKIELHYHTFSNKTSMTCIINKQANNVYYFILNGISITLEHDIDDL